MPSSNTSSSVCSSSPKSTQRGIKRKRDGILTTSVTEKEDPSEEENDDGDSAANESDDSSSDSDREASVEVHVLSHAARRRLRRQSQKEKPGPEPSSRGDDPQIPAQGEEHVPKRQHSIWVGNLAFKTNAQSLRKFFQLRVSGCDVTRIHLPTKPRTGGGEEKGGRSENRGFAYVDFSTKEAKEHAIALSEEHLDGRKLLIKDGEDFTGRPVTSSQTEVTTMTGKSKTAQRLLAAQKQPPAPTLFLGNLGFQATEASIKDMIEAHMKTCRQNDSKVLSEKEAKNGAPIESTDGKKRIRNVRMGTFEDSGLCKGWAFVDFYSVEDATAVLLDQRNHHLDGRNLVVEYASFDAVRRGGGRVAQMHKDIKQASKDKRNAKWAGKQDLGDSKLGDASKNEPTAENLVDESETPKKKAKIVGLREREDGRKGKRPRPGAALALAQRERVAIVPSSGKKIVF